MEKAISAKDFILEVSGSSSTIIERGADLFSFGFEKEGDRLVYKETTLFPEEFFIVVDE